MSIRYINIYWYKNTKKYIYTVPPTALRDAYYFYVYVCRVYMCRHRHWGAFFLYLCTNVMLCNENGT